MKIIHIINIEKGVGQGIGIERNLVLAICFAFGGCAGVFLFNPIAAIVCCCIFLMLSLYLLYGSTRPVASIHLPFIQKSMEVNDTVHRFVTGIIASGREVTSGEYDAIKMFLNQLELKTKKIELEQKSNQIKENFYNPAQAGKI